MEKTEINLVIENLAELLTNTVDMASVFYDIFLNPNPMLVHLKAFDNDNKLIEVTIPNRAMDRVTPYTGAGSPEGVKAAPIGAVYVDTASSTVYYKVSGDADDPYGWNAVISQSLMEVYIRSYLEARGYVTTAYLGTYLVDHDYVDVPHLDSYLTANGYLRSTNLSMVTQAELEDKAIIANGESGVAEGIRIGDLIKSLISTETGNSITLGDDYKLFVDDGVTGVVAGTYRFPKNLTVNDHGRVTYVEQGSQADITIATPTSYGIVRPDNSSIVVSDGVISSVRNNIGEIITSTIPLEDSGVHLLDGSLIQGGGVYSAFVTYMADIYDNAELGRGDLIQLPTFTSNTQDGITISDARSNTTTLQAIFNGSNEYNQIGNWNTYWININYDEPTYINHYSIQADNAPSTEYPSDWTLQASNDGSNWTIIDTQTGITFTPSEYKRFYINSDVTYKQYRIVFSNGVEASGNGELKRVSFNVNSQAKSGFTTEENWQRAITNYGVCGKFVYTAPVIYYAWISENSIYYTTTTEVGLFDVYQLINGVMTKQAGKSGRVTVANTTIIIDVTGGGDYYNYSRSSTNDYTANQATVRLPKITGIVEGTADLTALGNLVEAGLPNITGTLPGESTGQQTAIDWWKCVTGSFYKITTSNNNSGNSSGDYDNYNVGFNASLSSSIYGNSSTVQPQAIKVLYYIVIANVAKTPILSDIDNIAVDLNGKADIDLVNVSDAAMSRVSGWALPSETYVNLTLGQSEAEYIAPANGWVQVTQAFSTACSIGVSVVYSDKDGICMDSISSSSGTLNACIPVLKGETFKVWYNGTLNTSDPHNRFEFIYAKGSESEAN